MICSFAGPEEMKHRADVIRSTLQNIDVDREENAIQFEHAAQASA
jgi:hypothetical protein